MTGDTPRRFFVLHGWQSRRPPEHWHWQLVEELRAAGEQVLHTATLLTPEERVSRVLLVSPLSPAVLAPHAEVLEFGRVRHDGAALARAAESTRVVASYGDPYSPEGPAAVLAGLELDVDLLSGAGQTHQP